MIEDIIAKIKTNIDINAGVKKERVDFVAREFNENIEFYTEYIRNNKITEHIAFNQLWTIIDSMGLVQHLEPRSKRTKIKDLDIPYLKLGYFKIIDEEKLNPELYFEGLPVTLTEKGKRVWEEYNKISAANSKTSLSSQ